MQRSSNNSTIQGIIIAGISFFSSDIILDVVWRNIIELFRPLILGTESSEAFSIFNQTIVSYNTALFLLAIVPFLTVAKRFDIELDGFHFLGFFIAWIINGVIMNLIYLRL